MSDLILFIGSTPEGDKPGKISVYTVNNETAELTLHSENTEIHSPGFLALSTCGNFVYTVGGPFNPNANDGMVSAMRFDKESKILTLINTVSTPTNSPCHISVDSKLKMVITANYASGTFSAFPLNDDGSLAPASYVEKYEGSSVNETRQTASHAHSAYFDPDENFIVVQDLGLDCSFVYRYDGSSKLSEPIQKVASAPGAGPRHLAFHPNKIYAYRINELISSIDVLSINPGTGEMTLVQTVSTLPEDFTGESACADIHVSNDGRHVYGSNRGH
ncbi:MAG: lactonase family protein, partial [Lentisphaeria bacterium]|nr:lactonase family protein [Lentisphaeria bacterium]